MSEPDGREDPPGLRERLAGGVAGAQVLLDQLEGERDHRPGVDIALSLWEGDRTSYANLLSAALAFRLFLWATPLTLLLVTLTSLGVFGNDGSGTGIFAHLSMARELAEGLSDVSRERWTSHLWAAGIGLVGTLWTSRGVLRALRVTHLSVWGLPMRRSGTNPLRSAVTLLLVACGVLTGLVLVAIVEQSLPWLILILEPATLLALSLTWWAISLRFPHPEGLPARSLLPGALLVGVGVELLQAFTFFYLVDQADRAESTYGAIGVAITVLLWFFLLARLFVSATVLNAVLWEREQAGKVGGRILGFRLFGRQPGDRPTGGPSAKGGPPPAG
ncbi:MAG TPA: YhjD/YihY/BrkB family envelope integrity protein [Miltoncostaeaceae bacterium]|mgnify:CR=1 FL=1|nr:YhjD/YihY/BrkB family envelope integrity protein [Miltoncostaeaceae bacterium]